VCDYTGGRFGKDVESDGLPDEATGVGFWEGAFLSDG
jgi:hypothetical protein